MEDLMATSADARIRTFTLWQTHKYALLTTFKRDGSGVATPVSVVPAGPDRAYVRTYHRSGKAKRLRNYRNVELRACTMRGRPIDGFTVKAHARRLTGAEAKAARRALARRQPIMHGCFVPLCHKVMRYKTLHYELLPGHIAGGSPPGA
jgi:PPOX class probable F420-dependent enzyme